METTDKPVILIVENSIAYTGAFKAVMQTVEDLTEYFHFVFIIPQSSVLNKQLEEKGINYYRLPFLELSSRLKNILLYFPVLFINSIKLLQIINKEKVKIIHSNDLYNLAVLLPKLAKPKLKLLTHVRLLPGYIPSPLYKIMVFLHEHISDGIICVSEAVKKEVKGAKAIVIYDRIPDREKYPYNYLPFDDGGAVSLVYLGNYIQGKGQDYAIEAFSEAEKLNSGIKLIFIGGDMGLKKNKIYKESLIEKVKKLGLESKILFKDFVALPEPELKKHQVLLNFSDSESFSFSCLEGAYYGLPVIATNSGGPSEIIDDKYTGLIVKKGNIEEMKEAILRLVIDKDMRLNFSRNARNFVRTKFSFEKTSLKLKEAYLKLLFLDL